MDNLPFAIDGTESVPDCFKHLSSDTDKYDSLLQLCLYPGRAVSLTQLPDFPSSHASREA
jgi:hypothetical protein